MPVLAKPHRPEKKQEPIKPEPIKNTEPETTNEEKQED